MQGRHHSIFNSVPTGCCFYWTKSMCLAQLRLLSVLGRQRQLYSCSMTEVHKICLRLHSELAFLSEINTFLLRKGLYEAARPISMHWLMTGRIDQIPHRKHSISPSFSQVSSLGSLCLLICIMQVHNHAATQFLYFSRLLI